MQNEHLKIVERSSECVPIDHIMLPSYITGNNVE
jgi:hypothetical protein